MDNKMKNEIDETIKELNKFSSQIVDLKPSVDLELIHRFEEEFQIKLPADYKYLLSKTNGFSLMGFEVLGITYTDDYNLVNAYQFEHFEVIVPQYKHLIPFSPDGGGNFYCFDTSVKTQGGDSNRIVFWYSNYEYTESDPPEVTHESLADYVNNWIIRLTLEDYNYDGSEK